MQRAVHMYTVRIYVLFMYNTIFLESSNVDCSSKISIQQEFLYYYYFFNGNMTRITTQPQG